ncbi:GNAT family N-acetyltransferase [Chitinophaga nivalis]|uniref:GNAT family N-acetyltransferase n=1 Tax=Chitinophaga nivalis TaxID=2991709 RepID=A0ABT3IP82_9BACT|nr:GNAT family N-acetyltransferase [Chitinophaga nivalis]MCW3464556.1 GNAT family N-acetyltransferase [Chitinophaga nivalis]MCW3485753.1 GNAT family N-acetyltransferase [Chitinophaga nivalis]
MTHITFKALTTADVTALQVLATQTFEETFRQHNTPEDMQDYLDRAFTTAKLQQELANPDSRFWFVLEEGNPAGYLKVNFNTAQTELKEATGMEVERIYVAAAWLGKGVGQLLLDKAIQAGAEQGCAYSWLGVWENNQRAMRFYEKNGFVPFDEHYFTLGTSVQRDVMMKRVY